MNLPVGAPLFKVRVVPAKSGNSGFRPDPMLIFKRGDFPRQRDVPEFLDWAVTFIPIPMPKTVCITNLYKSSTAGSLYNFFRAGVWVSISELIDPGLAILWILTTRIGHGLTPGLHHKISVFSDPTLEHLSHYL